MGHYVLPMHCVSVTNSKSREPMRWNIHHRKHMNLMISTKRREQARQTFRCRCEWFRGGVGARHDQEQVLTELLFFSNLHADRRLWSSSFGHLPVQSSIFLISDGRIGFSRQ